MIYNGINWHASLNIALAQFNWCFWKCFLYSHGRELVHSSKRYFANLVIVTVIIFFSGLQLNHISIDTYLLSNLNSRAIKMPGKRKHNKFSKTKYHDYTISKYWNAKTRTKFAVYLEWQYHPSQAWQNSSQPNLAPKYPWGKSLKKVFSWMQSSVVVWPVINSWLGEKTAYDYGILET